MLLRESVVTYWNLYLIHLTNYYNALCRKAEGALSRPFKVVIREISDSALGLAPQRRGNIGKGSRRRLRRDSIRKSGTWHSFPRELNGPLGGPLLQARPRTIRGLKF